jgi:rhomboid protease GluP
VRRLSKEPLTLTLIALCVGWTLLSDLRHLTPEEAGALTGERLWAGEVWRLFTATILHHLGGWIHLTTNAISLFFVGRVIERGLGWKMLLAVVTGAALAGFATSLVVDVDPRMWQMGISGGIAGLIGLLLAVEWAVTKGVLDFLRQRNTLLILFFIALSFPFALFLERLIPNIKVDHWGHAGGFAFGLLFGLAYYTRRGLRATRGTVVGLLLAILPVAYATHPFLEPQYQVWRGKRALGAGDFDAAAMAFERASELDPRILDRGRIRDDVADAYLSAAAERLGEPEAATLIRKALDLGGHDARPWLRLAQAAEKKERWEDAFGAWREAAALLPDSKAWEPMSRALRLLPRRAAPTLRETIEVARGATMGFRAGLPPSARGELEKEIAATADAASRTALESGAKDEAPALAQLYWTLAENAQEDARRPGYRLRSAFWLWKATEGPAVPDDVIARFRATITEAALYGDPQAGEDAKRWFRERGMKVPEPDLEGEQGGG